LSPTLSPDCPGRLGLSCANPAPISKKMGSSWRMSAKIL
jgi:hypothetical protein